MPKKSAVPPVKKLTIAYLLGLSLIAFLIILAQVLTIRTHNRQLTDAPVINLSGRQRMLSEKIAKEVLLLAQSTSPEMREKHLSQLSITSTVWSRVHRGLRYGDKGLKLPGKNSAEVQKLLAEVDRDYLKIRNALDKIFSLNDAELARLSFNSPLARDIIEPSASFLKGMEFIVFQYDKEAQVRVDSLKRTEILILVLILILLILEALFIFRPIVNNVQVMYSALQSAHKKLERRVEERTAALIMANEQLQQQIEEREKTEEELQEVYGDLEDAQDQLIQAEKMHVVGHLASGVAHEVKNPLAVMMQGIAVLKKKIDAEEKDLIKTLDYMKNSVKRADNIIKGLLDFSRLTRLNTEPASVNSVLEKAVALVEYQFEKCDVNIVKDFSDSIPDIPIDVNKVEQVFVNLVLNAVHAMPDGGDLIIKTGTDTLRDDNGDWKEMVVVKISDTGTGIPEDMLEDVFSPFVTTRREKGGTGLGLPIVKNIIEMHSGTIEITNNKDRGATVSIFFNT
ncbi:ATP-binding protein [Candidatus Margulisiibacteriota bacterium]